MNSAKIANGSIATVDLADGLITAPKLSSSVAYLLNGGGLLASPNWYMNASQTASLSRKVSEQRSGIVLVFSAYGANGTMNYYFSSFFVPKQTILSYGGQGWEFDLDPSDRIGMAKYLYLSDTQVKGAAINGTSGTTPGGRKYDNSLYVLRYIIGV